MTTQLPIPKERLEKIASWRETYGAGHNVMLPAEEAEAMARALLAAYEQEPVAYRDRKESNGIRFAQNFDYGKMPDGAELFAHPAPSIPAAVPNYFAGLVASARLRADKAMRKYPQPNYVLNKVAEESGEVIKAVIHYTEGREEWENVEGEIIDNLAMLLRLVTEGDQVIGFTPPDTCRTVMLQAEPDGRDYRAIVERISEIMHGSVTDVDLLTVTVLSMKQRTDQH